MLDRLKNTLNYSIGRPTNAWAGLRTFAIDRLPVVGPDKSDDTFYWYSAQGGAGIKTAPALSAILRATFLDLELPKIFIESSISRVTFSASRFS
jgi:D-arginine dehydrogenase